MLEALKQKRGLLSVMDIHSPVYWHKEVLLDSFSVVSSVASVVSSLLVSQSDLIVPGVVVTLLGTVMAALVQLRQDFFFLKKTRAAAATRRSVRLQEQPSAEAKEEGIDPTALTEGDRVANGVLSGSEKMAVFTATFVNDLLFLVGALMLRTANWESNDSGSMNTSRLLNLLQAAFSLVRLAVKSVFAFAFFHRHLDAFVRPQYVVSKSELNSCGKWCVHAFFFGGTYTMILCAGIVATITFMFQPKSSNTSAAVMAALVGFALVWILYFTLYLIYALRIYVYALFCCPAHCKGTRIIDCCMISLCARTPKPPHPERTNRDTSSDLHGAEKGLSRCLFGRYFSEGVRPGFVSWLLPCIACVIWGRGAASESETVGMTVAVAPPSRQMK
eukprot:TRINITY_DN8471_c0_g1_i1.p1 TRINITY_DN8471_c0_g1~~TRINITY_DN8471_c0_g1_i1.p1  ORF type:complete len:388 (+),score=80.93 TRINITY_DN8471_c0_g1_i1:1-1164(+)